MSSNPVAERRRGGFLNREYITTRFYARGTISKAFVFKHRAIDGTRIYEGFITVDDNFRPNQVRVVADEEKVKNLEVGERVKITGTFRSSNTIDQDGLTTHLLIYLYAIRIEKTDSRHEDFTEIYIRGNICQIDKIRPMRYSEEWEFSYDYRIDFKIKGKNGERTFIAPCRAFNDLAKQIEAMKLGMNVCIRGEWCCRRYPASDGTMKTTYEIVVRELL